MARFFSTFSSLSVTRGGMSWILLAVIGVYAYPFVVPSLNSDDVIQVQSISRDALTFIAQGRWGYYIVFEWLQDNNPGGLFVGAVGLAILVASNWMAAHIIGLRRGVAVYAFLLLSSVSIYYGMLFDFSSTRLAYPLANLAAIGGLWLFMRGRVFTGIAVMSVAPALYPAAAQLAGTLVICTAIVSMLRGSLAYSWKKFLFAGLAIVASLLVYYVLTRVLYQMIGVSAGQRMSVSLFAALDNASIIQSLLRTHTFPFLCWECLDAYRTTRWLVPLLCLFIAFLVSVYLVWHEKRGLLRLVSVLLLVTLSFFSPFALAFAGANTPFPPRSLIGLAVLHGFWAAYALEVSVERVSRANVYPYLGAGVLLAAFLFFFDSSAQINNFAYDKHLATQADLHATNRIINRIEDVAARDERQLGRPQPIVVIYDTPLPASPRGDAGTSRHAPWSREWIFRLVDPRFLPQPNTEEAARESAVGRQGWPSHESVYFLEDGTVVVIINSVQDK